MCLPFVGFEEPRTSYATGGGEGHPRRSKVGAVEGHSNRGRLKDDLGMTTSHLGEAPGKHLTLVETFDPTKLAMTLIYHPSSRSIPSTTIPLHFTTARLPSA